MSPFPGLAESVPGAYLFTIHATGSYTATESGGPYTVLADYTLQEDRSFDIFEDASVFRGHEPILTYWGRFCRFLAWLDWGHDKGDRDTIKGTVAYNG